MIRYNYNNSFVFKLSNDFLISSCLTDYFRYVQSLVLLILIVGFLQQVHVVYNLKIVFMFLEDI